MASPGRQVGSWIGWFAALYLVTLILLAAKEGADQAHVVLAYLLVVLGGSTMGGRALAFALVAAGVLLIDYYFQPPYDTFSVGKSPDWVVLIAFLAVASVTTQLLARARAEADEARRRTEEVSALAQLGAETLSAGRAEEALAAVAALVQSTLPVQECEIYRWDGTRILGTALHARWSIDPPPVWSGPAAITAAAESPPPSSQALARSADALVLIPADGETGSTLLIPLWGHNRTVGVMRLTDQVPIVLNAGRRRFVAVLAYYAALAVERVALVAEAEHVEVLRETDRLRDVLMASLSHDLRTPLTSIKAMARQAAERGDPNAPAIEAQTDLLTRLVGDLLDWSRIKAGGFPVDAEINTAEDLIGAAVRQFVGTGSIPLVANVDLDQPALIGRFDFVLSLRILNNLIENAIRYSTAPNPVELSASLEGEVLAFRVADRGPGITVGERERIFEPFYRPANATPDVGRAGLGLSIARLLAEIQGGRVEYQPRPGGGSVFVLRLPAAQIEPGLESASL